MILTDLRKSAIWAAKIVGGVVAFMSSAVMMMGATFWLLGRHYFLLAPLPFIAFLFLALTAVAYADARRWQ